VAKKPKRTATGPNIKLLHYLELRNFKRFGDSQRIELEHPAVLIGPNNYGKTTAIQALALWSQAVKTWVAAKGESPPRQRTATAQVLRNLCLMVLKDSPDNWHRIVRLMRRLFSVELEDPAETLRGSINLEFRQQEIRHPLDIAAAGRGMQQMLLIFAYLHAHRRSVLLIDEPDAHLEILRQKQVYVLLREIADENQSQVLMVTALAVIVIKARIFAIT